jgi:beta-mannanase
MTVCRTSSEGSAPTCGAWLSTKMNIFAVGHQDASLAFYDTVSNAVIGSMKIPGNAQINKVESHPTSNLVFAGMDDGTLVAIDSANFKIVAT